LLYAGKPSNWGQDGQAIPEEFGLAEAGAENPYTLDVDKVSRLNGESLYALSYAQIFTSLKVSDVSLRLEIKPVFNVRVNLTAILEGLNEMVYTFEVATEKSGAAVSALVKAYVVAENFLQTTSVYNSDGIARFNLTVPNSVGGPAFLVVFAKSKFNNRIASYAVYPFAHNLSKPAAKGVFLKLSPLNYTLTVIPTSAEIVLSSVYALTFNYAAPLTQTASNVFSIPKFADASPIVLVATGWNSTKFFAEWTAYPQIPLQMGVDFSTMSNLSNVYAYEHFVAVGSAIYKCTVWLGGPKA
jgi:hypothetical protein